MSEWIKCSDRMPEHLMTVLLFFKGKYGSFIICGHFDEENQVWVHKATSFLEYSVEDLNNIILSNEERDIYHWMPLPSLPEK